MRMQSHAKKSLCKVMLAITAAAVINAAATPMAVAKTAPATQSAPMQCTTPTTPRYTQTPTGYLMVLRMGDNVFKELNKLAIAEKIPSASLSGIGVGNVKFGFWNSAKKDYDTKTFSNVEMANITGSLAWKNDEPSIHMHGVAGDANFQAHGGHILDLDVTTGSLEITVIVHQRRLERAIDPCVGANVLGV